MGSNKMGQLGIPMIAPSVHSKESQTSDAYNVGSPVLVEALKGMTVDQVSCGFDFTAVLCRKSRASSRNENKKSVLRRNEVYSWGNNKYGQLGVSELQNSNIPVRLTAFDVLDEEITQVSCGGSHSLFLTSEYDVISCGNNR